MSKILSFRWVVNIKIITKTFTFFCSHQVFEVRCAFLAYSTPQRGLTTFQALSSHGWLPLQNWTDSHHTTQELPQTRGTNRRLQEHHEGSDSFCQGSRTGMILWRMTFKQGHEVGVCQKDGWGQKGNGMQEDLTKAERSWRWRRVEGL